MKNLTAYLMLIVIALLTAAAIFKLWVLCLAALPVQIYIGIREKGKLSFIPTFIIYLIVEALFALLMFGIYKLICLI
jgi:hypothetical protein